MEIKRAGEGERREKYRETQETDDREDGIGKTTVYAGEFNRTGKERRGFGLLVKKMRERGRRKECGRD